MTHLHCGQIPAQKNPPLAAIAIGATLACAAMACREPSADSSGSTRASATPRIVTLSPSATEVVAALGAIPWVVGVDNYSAFPPEVKSLATVGNYIAPNLETIIRLRPTLVVVDDVHASQAAALHDRGVATIACAIHGLGDVKTALASIGARIGKSAEASSEIAGIDRSLDTHAAAKPAHHPRVLAVIDRETDGLGNLIAAGPGSWIDELLAVVGGDNVLAAAGIRYPKISAEEVMRTNPEVILDLSQAARQSLAPWARVDVAAVRTKRVFAVADAYLVAPSPRVSQALDRLAGLLRR